MAQTVSGPVEFYDGAAAALAVDYDSVAFADVHPTLLSFLPEPPARILDIGAGSGRDAIALAALGHRVVAVEPSASFRTIGISRSLGSRVEWMDDRLPDLELLRQRKIRFDFILCSAVLMSVPGPHLTRSVATMAALLAPGGRLAITLRSLVLSDDERLAHRHSPRAVGKAARAAGLSLLEERSVPDALGRPSHRWQSYVFTA